MNTKPKENNTTTLVSDSSTRIKRIAPVALFAFTSFAASASETGEEYVLPSTDDVVFAVGVIVLVVIVLATLHFISKKVHGDGKPSDKYTISHLINNDMPLNSFDFDFMYLHYDVGKLYESIKSKYRHIKSSTATAASKDTAEIFMLVAGKTLDALRECSKVELKETHTDSGLSLAWLREAEAGLLKIINKDGNRLGYSATDVGIPDSYILQERLDDLLIIATYILYQSDADSAYAPAEHTAMTATLSQSTLVKLHNDYLGIKKPHIYSDENTVFIDVALAHIFDDISEFFFRIDADMDDENNLLGVAQILNNNDWFKQVCEVTIESGGFYAH